MWKKVLLNVFYNVGIILCVWGIYWGFTNTQYLYSVIFALAGAFFVYQKINLIKEVKGTMRK